MKKLFFIAATAFLFTACEQQGTHETHNAADALNTTEAAPVAEEAKLTGDELIAKKDPVCQMDLDAAWTDSVAYQGKTVHFCSETCKAAFQADAEKYLK